MDAILYKHKLANRLLEISTDIRLLDKDTLLLMQPGDLEHLGIAVKEATLILEEIQLKNKVIASLMQKKRERRRSAQGRPER